MRNIVTPLLIAASLLVAVPAAFAAGTPDLITYDNQFILGPNARADAYTNMYLLNVNYDPSVNLTGAQIIEIQKIVNDMGNAASKKARIENLVGTRFFGPTPFYAD